MIEVGDPTKTESGARDFFGLEPHSVTISHIDTLSHHFWHGKMYNGKPLSLVGIEDKATACSLEVTKNGIVTLGVLLDIARLKGKPYLDAGEPIFLEDLEAAEKAQGVTVTEGDCLLIRTGWYKRRVELGPPTGPTRPGLHAATLPWLRERGVALVAADAVHDVSPSGYPNISLPVHSIGTVAMGLWLIDACQFEDLAAQCERAGRWQFVFIVAPMRFKNATGSPVTPIAVL
jgi:kynurenine formamidase